jgi:hypothetical protein
MDVELPTWDECEAAVDLNSADALQQFIYDNEPAGADIELKFREQLAAVVKYSYKQGWNDREADLLIAVDRIGAPDELTALKEDHAALCRLVTGGFNSMKEYDNG